jgi:hypothetical protein
MTPVDHIDSVLLSNLSPHWRKAAMVVAKAMSQLHDVEDSTFQQRLESLAQRGIIEASGDLTQMRQSEVRLKHQGRVMSNNSLERP